jgi:hypothetical protein
MGGPGSGNWWRWQGKKNTVEDSLALGMKDLRKRLFAGAAGTLTWTWASGRKSSIDYYVTGSADWPTVHLHYRWADKEDANIPVRLEATPTQFGGRRWWPYLPAGRARHRLQPAGGQAVPAPWGEILWLPQVPRPDVSKLPGSASGRAAVRPAGLRRRSREAVGKDTPRKVN